MQLIRRLNARTAHHSPSYASIRRPLFELNNRANPCRASPRAIEPVRRSHTRTSRANQLCGSAEIKMSNYLFKHEPSQFCYRRRQIPSNNNDMGLSWRCLHGNRVRQRAPHPTKRKASTYAIFVQSMRYAKESSHTETYTHAPRRYENSTTKTLQW